MLVDRCSGCNAQGIFLGTKISKTNRGETYRKTKWLDCPKDVILKVAGILTVKGGTGSIVEYFGEGNIFILHR